jgi:hypothetical protein
MTATACSRITTAGGPASYPGAGSIGDGGFPQSLPPSTRSRCIIDGELIACDANGLADFQLLRWRKRDDPAIYCAFDLLQIDGRDLRNESMETRKAELARLLTGCQPLALVLNRVFDDSGPVVFAHACKLGCKGIVSKRRGSLYARGRSSNWLKVKTRTRRRYSGRRKRIGPGLVQAGLSRQASCRVFRAGCPDHLAKPGAAKDGSPRIGPPCKT